MSVVSNLFSLFVGTGAVLLVLNELRGVMLAAPVLYGIYQAGGTLAAIWVGICSLAGIALSVFLPLIAARKIQRARRRSRLHISR